MLSGMHGAVETRPDTNTATMARAEPLVTEVMAAEVRVTVSNGGRLRVQTPRLDVALHPQWLRERSTVDGEVDAVNGQRLLEPTDVAADLAVVACAVEGIDAAAGLSVTFSDGHRMAIALERIERETGMVSDAGGPGEASPRPVPWVAESTATPVIDFRRLSTIGPDAIRAKREALTAFFELGFFVLSNTPAEPGALHEITSHFGRISPTNFGSLFDVRTEPIAVDLAYTPVALSAHTDQPYRAPVPGIQFLHTIVNDAPGGASTMVDGMAAVDALAAADPEAHDLLCSLPIEFRYDIGSDVKVGRAPLIQRRLDGSLRQFRFSPRLDFAPLIDADTLDVYYRGRRWLAEALNDPDRQIEYRMSAGEVLVVDNHRVLHGRTSFDPTRGNRHLQGCYIDHDGPLTEWILNGRADTRGNT